MSPINAASSYAAYVEAVAAGLPKVTAVMPPATVDYMASRLNVPSDIVRGFLVKVKTLSASGELPYNVGAATEPLPDSIETTIQKIASGTGAAVGSVVGGVAGGLKDLIWPIAIVGVLGAGAYIFTKSKGKK